MSALLNRQIEALKQKLAAREQTCANKGSEYTFDSTTGRCVKAGGKAALKGGCADGKSKKNIQVKTKNGVKTVSRCVKDRVATKNKTCDGGKIRTLVEDSKGRQMYRCKLPPIQERPCKGNRLRVEVNGEWRCRVPVVLPSFKPCPRDNMVRVAVKSDKTGVTTYRCKSLTAPGPKPCAAGKQRIEVTVGGKQVQRCRVIKEAKEKTVRVKAVKTATKNVKCTDPLKERKEVLVGGKVQYRCVLKNPKTKGAKVAKKSKAAKINAINKPCDDPSKTRQAVVVKGKTQYRCVKPKALKRQTSARFSPSPSISLPSQTELADMDTPDLEYLAEAISQPRRSKRTRS